MLTNLATHAAAVGDPKKAAMAKRCQALLDEESPEEFDPQPRPIPPAR
jgi:hypothetical protein